MTTLSGWDKMNYATEQGRYGIKIMKKILAGLLAFLMIFAGMSMLSTPAKAESGDLDISVTATPDGLYAEGNVTLNITLKNKTDNGIQNIKLKATGGSYSDDATVDQIEKGQSTTVKMENFPVSDDLLDKPITVTVTSYDEGSPALPQSDHPSATVTVSKKTAAPNVTITRSMDKKIVTSGDKVTITYKVTNSGDVTLTNMVLSDMGTTVKTIGTLKAGQNSGTITKEFTITKEASSKPSVSYKVEATGDTGTKTIDSAVTIALATTGLNISLSSSKATVKQGETVEVSCDLSNLGNVQLVNIDVTDDEGTVIKSGITLKAGGKTNFTKIYSISESRDIVFTAAGEDTSGKTVTKTSQKLSITVPVDTDNIKSNLKLVVSPSAKTLDKAGTVKFTLTVTNGSTVTLNNVDISETTLGEIGHLDEMDPGTQKFEASADLTKETTFVFSLMANDTDGNNYSISTEPLTISVGMASASQSPQPSATEQPTSSGTGLGTLLILFVVLVVLILAAGVVLIILIRQDKIAKKKQTGSPKKNPDDRTRREPGVQPSAPQQISLDDLDLKKQDHSDLNMHGQSAQQDNGHERRPYRQPYNGSAAGYQQSSDSHDSHNEETAQSAAYSPRSTYGGQNSSGRMQEPQRGQSPLNPRRPASRDQDELDYPDFNNSRQNDEDAYAPKPVRRVKGKTDMGDTQEMPPIRIRDKNVRKPDKDDHYNDFL